VVTHGTTLLPLGVRTEKSGLWEGRHTRGSRARVCRVQNKGQRVCVYTCLPRTGRPMVGMCICVYSSLHSPRSVHCAGAREQAVWGHAPQIRAQVRERARKTRAKNAMRGGGSRGADMESLGARRRAAERIGRAYTIRYTIVRAPHASLPAQPSTAALTVACHTRWCACAWSHARTHQKAVPDSLRHAGRGAALRLADAH